jgi:hypothetical protein
MKTFHYNISIDRSILINENALLFLVDCLTIGGKRVDTSLRVIVVVVVVVACVLTRFDDRRDEFGTTFDGFFV